MSSRYGWLLVCLVAVMALLESATEATQYTVGDGYGWAVPPNNSSNFYDDWVSNKTFQIGDSLLFNWTGKGNHSVAEVREEYYYDNCTKSGMYSMSTVYDGEPDGEFKIYFSRNTTYYFICTIDTHCEQGQKVKIVVGDDTGSASSLVAGALSLLLSALVFQFLALYCT